MSVRFHRSRGRRGVSLFWYLSSALCAASLAACSGGDDVGSFASTYGGGTPDAGPAPLPVPDGGPPVPAPGDPAAPPSLKTVKVPEPANLGDFVKDRTAAIVLGKALFWDMQVGSDGIQACASCHFHAGADSRSKNQLSPGVARPEIGAPANRDKTFQIGGGANYQLKREDFPFHKKRDPNDRTSPAISDANDVSSSQGVSKSLFVESEPGRAEDRTKSVPDPDGFRVGDVNVRRVEARQTPTVINAVFNFRNFWDGRAQNEFNGVNSLGAKDPNAFLFKATPAGDLAKVKVLLTSSSLASQAMEPPLSGLEMSGEGRTFPDIGDKLGAANRKDGKSSHRGCGSRGGSSKLLPLRPLGKQKVHPEDSVLGCVSRYPKAGLEADSYIELVQKAFRPDWWKSSKVIEVDAKGVATIRDKASNAPGSEAFTLMEYNFSLFFGLAVQMYEATLVSDDTPFDRFREGDTNAMTAQQKRGLDLFLSQTRGRCINCHGGPELTDASETRLSRNRLRRREGNIIDFGFNNIGVRPTFEDLAVGGTHPLAPNVILSEARLAFLGLFNDPSLVPPIGPADTLGVDGAFKVPGLRNVELTAPYFHNGGTLSLRGVVDFYSRGGDFFPIVTQDPTRAISPLTVLNSTEEEKQAFVAFLTALTDERVRYRRAPFDQPQIFVPNGHPGDTKKVRDDGKGVAVDDFLEIPANGRNGAKPLPNFLEK